MAPTSLQVFQSTVQSWAIAPRSDNDQELEVGIRAAYVSFRLFL